MRWTCAPLEVDEVFSRREAICKTIHSHERIAEGIATFLRISENKEALIHILGDIGIDLRYYAQYAAQDLDL